MDTKHQWVPVEECGELEDGKYVVVNAGIVTIDLYDCGTFVGWHTSHVLNPAMGPIPEVE